MVPRTSSITLAVAVAWFAASGAALADEHRVAPKDWHDVKCARYRTAWSAALGRMGTQGLSRGFLDKHQAFLASNCTLRSDVCPRSPQELKLANVMVMMSMNFGTASTFVPFYCH